MKFLRDTIAGGILFLVPFVVLVIIIERALELANKIVAPIAARIPVNSVIGIHIEKLLAITGILLFCFLTGFLARTALAQKLTRWLESNVLINLPGYEFFKRIGEDLMGVGKPDTRTAVFAYIGDTCQIGFLIERLDNGLAAVFVPGAPNPHSGVVQFVPSERLVLLKASHHEILRCLKRLGTGTNVFLGNLPAIPSTKGDKT